MASSTIIPTRMELTRLKRKLVTARKGHKLLKDKRDELMRQFLIMVRENRELRESVEKGIGEANQGFALARSTMSDEAVRVAFMAPKQRVSIGVSYKNIMSVNVPEYSFETRTSDASDMFSYGFAFTSADLDGAVEQLSGVFESMLKLAQMEKSCQLMAAEIEKTRRRVNALEHVMIPQLEEDIKYITMKLDENERSSQIRLMKVKDMMLEEAHHYEEREEKRAAQKAAAGA
ncbi:MAG TPA: V-type ATP synthase subunit D [Lachnospiraceae bacterium]|nr:V-type ATP synthase subunit D [Lachnospiraceae bacterium]